MTQSGVWIRRCHLHRRPIRQAKRRVHIVLRLLAHRLNKWKLRNGEGRRNTRLLKEDHSIAGANHPALTNPVRQSNTRTEIATFQFPRCVGKLQNLCLEIEDRPLIALLRRREIQSVTHADVDREPWRNLPVVADEKLGNMRARLNHSLLDVDGECVHLPQQQRGHCISASSDRRAVRAGCTEGERSRGIGRIHHIQRFSPDIRSELNRVPPTHQRECVQVLGDRGAEI